MGCAVSVFDVVKWQLLMLAGLAQSPGIFSQAKVERRRRGFVGLRPSG
jgi:hypothetical protein